MLYIVIKTDSRKSPIIKDVAIQLADYLYYMVSCFHFIFIQYFVEGEIDPGTVIMKMNILPLHHRVDTERLPLYTHIQTK